MRILVTFAVEAEFAPWRRLRKFATTSVASKMPGWKATYAVYRANIDGVEVHAALTGMGYQVARLAMGTLLEELTPDVCVSSGFAGAVKATLRPGDVLAASWVRPLQGERRIASDPDLVEVASQCGAKRVDCFVSSNHVVSTALEKRPLGEFADAVELESFRILCAAKGRGIPAAAIRVVSDAADEDMPYDFGRFLDQFGRVSWPRALAQIAARPGRIPQLARLTRQSQLAAESLCRFLSRYVAALGEGLQSRDSGRFEEVAAT